MSGNKDHNAGQTDGSKGEYNRPVSHTEEFFTWSPSGTREVAERLSQYNSGHRHAKSQR